MTRTRQNVLIRLSAALCCLALCVTVALPASAAEGILDCTYLKITGDGFVADTMNGVESRYNLYGPTLYCVELITRYYREVYGLDLRASGGAPKVLNNPDLYFEETDSPKPGDVLYGSAAARGKGYNHWALVKSFQGDSLTLFEQNWRWNGQAGINRQIQYPTKYYKIYTLKSRSGAAIKPVSGSVAVVSDWAESYIDRAAEAGIADLGADYQASVTREDFCQMALNVLSNYGVRVTGSGAAGAKAMNLVSNEDGSQLLTREEAAVITSRLTAMIGDVPAADLTVLNTYADAADISDWSAPAVAQMTACGLMGGTAGSFRPQSHMTNEQAVALMVRVDENPNPALSYRSGSEASVAECAAEGIVALSAGNMMLSRPDRYLSKNF